MTFTSDAHTPYQWVDAPRTDTPLDSAHLEAAETDLVNYTQSQDAKVVNYFEGGSSPKVVIDTPQGAIHIGPRATGATSAPYLTDWCSVREFGAVQDAIQAVGGAITSGSNQLSISGGFQPTDVNKYVMVPGAGANQGPFAGYVGSVAGGVASIVTTKGGSTPANAGTTVSGVAVTYGTPNLTAFQNAYNTGLAVFVPSGGSGYVIEGQLTGNLPLNMFELGIGVGARIFYSSGNWWPIQITGTGPGASIALAADANAGDHTLTLSSTAGLSVGQYLLLNSTAEWCAIQGLGAVEAAKQGEVVRIQAVNSATQVTLQGPVDDIKYAVSNGAQVFPMTYLSDHVLEGLDFINSTPEIDSGSPPVPSAYAGSTSCVEFKYCQKVSVNRCRFFGAGGATIIMSYCLDYDVDDCLFHDGAIVPTGSTYASTNAFGYGVMADGPSQFGTVRNCKSRGGHHAIFTTNPNDGTYGGIPRWHTISDCFSYDSDVAAFHTHVACRYIYFVDDHAVHSPYNPGGTAYAPGFILAGQDCWVIGGSVDGVFGSAGQTGSNSIDCGFDGLHIKGVYMEGSGAGAYGIGLFGTRPKARGIKFKGLSGSTMDGIHADVTAVNPEITDMILRGFTGRYAIYLASANARLRGLDLDCSGNSGDGVYIASGATGAEVSKVIVRNTSGHGINNQDATDSAVFDDVLGIGNGGYVINYAAASPQPQASRIRAISAGSGVTNKPSALQEAQADDGFQGLIAPSPRNFPYSWTNITPTANTAYVARIRPSRQMTITKLAFQVTVAATANDNIDVGIYDNNGTRLTSNGSTPSIVNATGIKVVTLTTPVTLQPGHVYYVALAYGTVGGTAAAIQGGNVNSANNASLLGTTGVNIAYTTVATSFPLPSTLVLAAPSAATFPVFAAREA